MEILNICLFIPIPQTVGETGKTELLTSVMGAAKWVSKML